MTQYELFNWLCPRCGSLTRPCICGLYQGDAPPMENNLFNTDLPERVSWLEFDECETEDELQEKLDQAQADAERAWEERENR